MMTIYFLHLGLVFELDNNIILKIVYKWITVTTNSQCKYADTSLFAILTTSIHTVFVDVGPFLVSVLMMSYSK